TVRQPLCSSAFAASCRGYTKPAHPHTRFRSPSRRPEAECRTTVSCRPAEGRENAVADDRRDQRARCCRAQEKESTKLRTTFASEGCGNTAAVDVHPARYPRSEEHTSELQSRF